MSRIKQAFQTKAKIAYLTAEPDNFDHFLALVQGGANILEIGIPFSDPVADGPVIQRAMTRSLAKGMNVQKVLALVAKLRAQTEAALLLFTYFNPIQKDPIRFAKEAKAAGADGLLIVDLPFSEAPLFHAACKKEGLALIPVVAPSTSNERIEMLARSGSGFLYYACRKGTTGARDALPPGLEEKISSLKSLCSLPIAIGFGIADAKSAQQALKLADGCVIGSHFVSQVEKGCTPQALKTMTQEIFVC